MCTPTHTRTHKHVHLSSLSPLAVLSSPGHLSACLNVPAYVYISTCVSEVRSPGLLKLLPLSLQG